MALEDIAPGVFGQFPDMAGALSPEQAQALQQNAAKQALLASAVTMLGMSGPQRVPVGTGQAIGAALGAGLGGYQGSFDNTLKQMIAAQQMQEYRKKAEFDLPMKKLLLVLQQLSQQAQDLLKLELAAKLKCWQIKLLILDKKAHKQLLVH